MKQAIFTGATGIVGGAVVRRFVDEGLPVLCLVRDASSSEHLAERFGAGVKHLCGDVRNLEYFEQKLAGLQWDTKVESVFFNFAWGGNGSLTGGGFSKQIKNAVNSACAVKIAKKLNCRSFVNVGSLEETFAEKALATGKPFKSDQCDYALAKLSARDMSKMTAYLEKIDYIHTRMSVPLDLNLRGGYISSTIRRIKDGKAFEKPRNDELFDIIPTDLVAEAYFRIGLSGVNGSDYFIGTSKPLTLRNFFDNCSKHFGGEGRSAYVEQSDPLGFFDTSRLELDCGFRVTGDPYSILDVL